MTADKIKDIIKCGETSTVQFKRLFKTAEDIANELVAFSNSRGGSIFVGIDDKTGEIVGLDFSQLQALGSLVASAADDRMHPVVYPEIETVLVDGKAVMIITVPKGCDAPYTNKKGEIYVKQGCDKRRVTDNSPGALPPTLTVDDIKLGNAFQRNQLIANLCAKTMDYRGLGSGIIRALQADANIEFHNEVSGDQFRVILWRPTQKTESKEKTTQKTEGREKTKEETTLKTTQKTEGKEKTTQKIISLMKSNPYISREEIARSCEVTSDAIKLQIKKLKDTGKIRRIGPDKGGYWEVIE